jgi:hypothetical protein
MGKDDWGSWSDSENSEQEETEEGIGFEELESLNDIDIPNATSEVGEISEAEHDFTTSDNTDGDNAKVELNEETPKAPTNNPKPTNQNVLQEMMRNSDLGNNMPKHNELLQFLNGFEKIQQGIFKISELAYTIVNELETANKEASTITIDVSEVLKKYDAVSTQLHGVITETQKYFELNKTIVHNLAEQKRGLNEASKQAAERLSQSQKDYIDIMNRNVEIIISKIETIAKDIDLSEIKTNLQQEISKEIKTAGLSDFKTLTEQVSSALEELKKQSDYLLGNEKKDIIGAIEGFGNMTDKISKNTEKIKKSIKYSFLLTGTIFGLFVGVASGVIYSASTYEERFSQELGIELRKLNDIYSQKLQEKEEALTAFKSFKRRYGLNGEKMGFGFFNDTKTPFFYYNTNMQSYKVKDNIIVEIPQK